jgi:hypothetical protein
MADNRCFARITTSETKLSFRTPKHYFFQEGRCKREKIPGELICLKCCERKNKKPKYEQDKWHGLIMEPIPDDSHIYGGSWFESKVLLWGEGSEEDMARAKKSQAEAREGLNSSEPVTLSKRRRITKKPEATTAKPEATTVIPEATTVIPEAPKKKMRKPKTVLSVPAFPPTQLQAVESARPTLTNIEVVTIQVKRFEHNDTQYYLDSKKLKLYSRQPDGTPGIYVGRWNPSEEKICKDVPDSDTE